MKRTQIIFVTVVVALIALGNIASYASETTSDVTITYYGGMNASESERFQRLIVAPFEAANPGIRIEHINPASTGESSLDKFFVLVASGEAPDISAWGQEHFPNFANSGILFPLDQLLAKHSISLESYVAPAVERYQWNGQQYGLPTNLNATVGWYNQSLFDEAGIEAPNADWASAWSWDEFISIAQRLTRIDGNGAVEQWGLQEMPWPTIPWIFGGDWISPDGRSATTNLPESVQGFQLYHDLMHTHGVMPPGGVTRGGLFIAG